MSNKTVVMTKWLAVDAAVDLHHKKEQLRARRDHWLLVACSEDADVETKDNALIAAEEAELEMQKL